MSCPVDGGERERFEAEKAAIGRIGIGHRHQILDADAVGAGLVVAGLVGDDHAGRERRARAQARDALRAFVHVQVMAHAVPGAVIVVEARLPQELTGERVQLRAGGAARKARQGERDVAAQHAGEAVPMLRLGRADRDRAGHVGGAVQVLPAGVDEVERARLQRAVRLRRHPVVDDGTVGAGARNGVEAGAAEVLAAGTHRRQTADGIQLGDGAGRGSREPGQEAGQRRTIPAMGGTDAGKLDLVLARLGQCTGIGAANYLGAALRQAIHHPDRRRRLVDQYCRARLRKPIEHVCNRVWRLHPHRIAKMSRDFGQELAAIHEPVDIALAMNDGEGMGEGAVGDVGAPHVEQPGDRIGRAQHRGGGTLLCEPGGDCLPLLASFDAREAHRVGADGAKRRRRLVVPHRVDGIVLARDEARANGLARRRQPVAAVRAVQPGVVAERGIRRKVATQPRVGGLVGDVAMLVKGAVHLRRRLQGIAPVDEERRPLGQHDRHAGRAREAGEPGQALRAPRHVLALVLVAERHHEAVEPPPRELSPERREAVRYLRGVDPIRRLGVRLPERFEPLGQRFLGLGVGMDQAQPVPVQHRSRGDALHQCLDLVDGCLDSGVGQRLGQRVAPFGRRVFLRHGGVSASATLTASISAWPRRPGVCGAKA